MGGFSLYFMFEVLLLFLDRSCRCMDEGYIEVLLPSGLTHYKKWFHLQMGKVTVLCPWPTVPPGKLFLKQSGKMFVMKMSDRSMLYTGRSLELICISGITGNS